MVDHHAALLLLADGRLPAGAYAHSAGLEPAVHDGYVRTLEDVRSFAEGRLETVGRVAATFAAAACHAAHGSSVDEVRLAALDGALDARMPSPASRATSRQLGRQLVRVATTMGAGGHVALLGPEPHQPLALGVTCAAFDLTPRDAALVVLHETAAGVIAAAVRLLSLDPLAAHRVLADCRSRIDELADLAEADCVGDVVDLPAAAAPLLDVFAERHGRRAGRLFAS